MRSITIFCPDSHLAYDRPTLDTNGVGGGATIRVRMAYALAALGHRVRLYINCPKENDELGVETRHYSELKKDHPDIFIASTSGGKFDLSALGAAQVESRLKILLVHGVVKPNGLASYPFDFVYSPSNFIRGKAAGIWGIKGEKIFVSQHGVMEANFTRKNGANSARDPAALVYTGHPSKGLENAQAILHSLRTTDPSFHLHVYGDAGLWGEKGEPMRPEAGITFHGTIGQRKLARELQNCSFSLNLQHRQEPFGMTIIEAMRGGCIVLASPVGAYPEIITHGKDGFLIPGDPFSETTRRSAANLILGLVGNPEYAGYLRRNAMQTPLTWEQVARTWEGHWAWVLAGADRESFRTSAALGSCNECRGTWLPLADGLHCTRCGNYQRKSPQPVSS
jgi:glycosyltransferase involved in cell wall biosynthesis